MSALLEKMMAELSAQDKQVFKQLAERLKAVKGDIARLPLEDLQLIQAMEQKYAASVNRAASAFRDSQPVQSPEQQALEVELLELPFAQQVRQILARSLGHQFPLEQDAVAFAFDNKWLPQDFNDPDLADSLYQRFEEDIKLINQWRADLVAVELDKKMALGLAWFMVIYQLQQRLSEA